MAFAHVAGPPCGAARAARGSERNGILARQHAGAFQTLLRDDVARENLVVLAQHGTHVGDELLDLAHEIGMDVGLHAADGVVSLDQAAAGGLLQDVEHLLAVAETVEEGRQRAHVHAQAGEEEQVRINALQLVHDRADVLHALRHLDAQPLFDAHAEGVAVLRRPEVVETVRQGEGLGIGQLLAHLLDAAVDVAAVHVEFFNDLAFERHAEAQHAVRGRVLGTDVDDVLLLLEKHVAPAYETAVGLQLEGRGAVLRHLVAHAERVRCRIVVLAQGMSHPIVAQVQPPHVGMVQKTDAEVVERLALVQLGGPPQVAHRGQDRAFAFRSQRPHHNVLARRGGFEVVHHAEALFAPVHAREAAQEIEAFGLQAFGHPAESFRRHGEHPLAGLRPHGRRLPGLHFICQGHNSRFSSSTFKSFFSAVRSLRSSRSYSSRPICRFTPPKKRCSFTLRWSCISP